MAGAFVCASLGIVPTVRHADYIGSWLEVLREDNRAIVRAASAGSKAADFLLAFLRPRSTRRATAEESRGGRVMIAYRCRAVIRARGLRDAGVYERKEGCAGFRDGLEVERESLGLPSWRLPTWQPLFRRSN